MKKDSQASGNKLPTKPKPGKKKKHVKEKDTNRLLQYKFSDKEMQGMGADVAKLITDLEQSKANKKATVTQLDANIKSLESQMLNVSTLIRNGYEMRGIDCLIRLDYNRGTVKVIRKDNKEVVEDRAMTPDETQVELDLQAADKTKKEKDTKEDKPNKGNGKGGAGESA